VIKQQIEEKLSAVAVLRNSPGIDRSVIHDVEGMLSTVMKQCAARERKLQQSLQLVCQLCIQPDTSATLSEIVFF